MQPKGQKRNRITTGNLSHKDYESLKTGAESKGFKSLSKYLDYIVSCYLSNEYLLDHYSNLFNGELDQHFNELFQQLYLINQQQQSTDNKVQWIADKYLDL